MRFLSNLLTLLVLAGLAFGGLLFYANGQFEAPGPAQSEQLFEVPRGAGLSRIASDLERAGAISDARIFRYGARAKQAETSLKAGEYALPAGASMSEILTLLKDGATVARRVTIKEGLTAREIVALLQGIDGLSGDITEIPPEGSLAPETYFYERGEARSSILRRMTDAQRVQLDELWATRAADLPFSTKEEAMVLASIIERETAVASERAEVAGVFVNRLRRGMRLQSDPTVIYGATGGLGSLGRGIRRSELDAETPFNTYRIKGLPPTPIANPGRDSIAAALNPALTDALYFVADGTGGHAFARTLKQHNRNVAQWRRIERERAKGTE